MFGIKKRTRQAMPISMEQWRAGVGSNNAARSRVMGRCIRKRSPKCLLSQFLSLLMTLFAPWVGLVAEGRPDICVDQLRYV